LKHCRELFSREAEKAHTLDRMKPLHKFLIGCIVCVVGGYLFHLMLQVGGHYNATIKPSGEDTQVFVFVEDSPKFQILFEKKSTAEAVKISPRKVAAPDWKETFMDPTVAPGRWTIMFHSVELDFFSDSVYINKDGPFRAGKSIKIREDGKVESAGQLDPVAVFAK
jgi:hypothetical protein